MHWEKDAALNAETISNQGPGIFRECGAATEWFSVMTS